MSTRPDTAPQGFRFGVFELDVPSGELRKEGRLLRIRNQPLRILTVLLRNPGAVVSREQLHRELWHADELVDFDQGLNHGIREIRMVLGDDPDSPRFIQTLPRRGYRFLADVRPILAPTEEGPPAASAGELDPPSSASEKPWPSEHGWPRPRRGALAAGAAVAALVSLIASASAWTPWLRDRIGRAPRASEAPVARLLVLPFTAASSSEDDVLVADGLTDEVIARVGKARPGAIEVLGRTSSFEFKARTPRLSDLQRDLRVTHMIEGRVRRTGHGLRAVASLVRVPDGARLWSLDDAEYEDLDAFLRRVSARVAHGVHGVVEMPLTLQRAFSGSVEANLDYLRGRALMANRDGASLAQAVAAFEACLRREPGYGAAWAALAEARVAMMDQGLAPPAQTWIAVKAHTDRALSLDPELAEGWNVLAAYHSMFEGDWASARRAMERALSLNPNLVIAHHWNSVRLGAMGNHADAEAAIRRAIELDPVSPVLHGALGSTLSVLGRRDEALREFETAADLRPEWAMTHVWIGRAMEREGRWSDAAASYARGAALGDSASQAYLVRALSRGGELAKAREAYSALVTHPNGYVAPYYVALASFSLGDREAALAGLRKTVAERSPLARRIADQEEWGGFETDPRFQRLAALVVFGPKPRR